MLSYVELQQSAVIAECSLPYGNINYHLEGYILYPTLNVYVLI